MRRNRLPDIVLDPMMGCGTTCVAAAKLGRRFIGIDIGDCALETSSMRLDDVGADYEVLENLSSAAEKLAAGKSILIQGDCLEILPELIEQGVRVELCYCDPPYFSNREYKDKSGRVVFSDKFKSMDDYLAWMEPRVRLMRGILT